jgi:hypothetical protein
MRICLARCRNTPPDHGDKTWDLDADGRPKLPTAVADEAYRTFVKLADRSEHEGDAIVTQIAKIRAALLRDLLAGGPRPRSGVVPDFAARSPEPKILIEDAVEDEIAVLDPDEDDRRGWARA